MDEQMVRQEIITSVRMLEPSTDGFNQNADGFLESGFNQLLGMSRSYAEIELWGEDKQFRESDSNLGNRLKRKSSNQKLR